MSVSKINFNDNQEAYILVEPISEIDRTDFKTYLDLDSPSFLPCEFENDKAFYTVLPLWKLYHIKTVFIPCGEPGRCDRIFKIPHKGLYRCGE